MSDRAPLIERAFSLDPREQSYFVEEIEGEIPSFIQGTYYLNGPGRFSRAGLNYRHWLDGDGMVCALRLEGCQVQFTNRFIRSAKFVAEQEAGRPIYRTFGTSFESDRLKRGIALESPVNVSVYPYSGTLLTFGEQGLPVELDPVTLETCGEFDFGGRLNDISPFAAHPKFDSTNGEMFNFGIAFSDSEPNLNLYRFDEAANLLYRKRLRLDYACSIHDFSLSQRYAVFYLSPYILKMGALAREGRTLMESLNWEPDRGSRLLIVTREKGEQVAVIIISTGYCLHMINCFEENNRLNVDVVEFARPIYDQYQEIPNLFTDVKEGRPVRYIVGLDTRELVDVEEIGYRLAPDFPSIDPRRAAQSYNDFWMLGISATGRRGRKFFDQLVRANWADPEALDIYQAPAMHYFGAEPIFIGDPNDPEAGVVISQIFNAKTVQTMFVLFNAFDVASGPIATIHLKYPMPFGFHASFKQEAIERNYR